MNLPPALLMYRLTTHALGPFSRAMLRARARAGKEDGTRLEERFAHAPMSRPAGELIWLHGASVGECGVLLQIHAELAARRPESHFLITSGTLTSAAMITKRAPARTIHQFAPLDRVSVVRRFFAHWRPNIGIFAESDLWPNLVLESHRAGTPLALVNARMSARSLKNWRRTPASARALLGGFALVLAADRRTADGIGALLGEKPANVGNLKLASATAPPDPGLVQSFQAAIAGRPAWIAASTHPGEDEIALAAHARLREIHRDALLILAPRHPQRGEAIAALAGDAPRRSQGETIGKGPVYVLDTIGEMGALFAAVPAALMCGSLLPSLRGHNPIEPTQVGCAVISGPFVESFSELYDELFATGGAALVRDGEEIAAAIAALWTSPQTRARRLEATQTVFAHGRQALHHTVAALEALMESPTHAAA
jgi:3-deoxy-D-manno-octulosonic-acid transferase